MERQAIAGSKPAAEIVLMFEHYRVMKKDVKNAGKLAGESIQQ